MNGNSLRARRATKPVGFLLNALRKAHGPALALSLVWQSSPLIFAQIAPTPLSLPGAIELALEQNPAIRAARAGVDAGQAGVGEAKATLLPRVDYIESFTRSDNPVFVFGTLLNQRRFTEANFALDRLNNPQALNLNQSRLMVEQTLFAGGRNYLELKRARLQRDKALEGERQASMQLVFGVIRSYYGVQVAQANQGVVEDARSLAEEDLARAEALFAAGMATEADVLSMRVQLADLEEQLIVARNVLEIQRTELNEMLGEPLGRSFSLLTELALSDDASNTGKTSADRDDLGELEALALSERPEMRQTSLDFETASITRRQAKAAFLPSVAFHGGWESDRAGFTGSGGTNWMVGLSMRINLFNGLGDRARLQKAQAGFSQAEARRTQLENQLRLEVRRASLEREAARKRYQVAESAVTQARESHRITQARYEGGLSGVTDLLRSQNARLQSEARQLGALYETRLAEAGLALATGTLTPNAEATRP